MILLHSPRIAHFEFEWLAWQKILTISRTSRTPEMLEMLGTVDREYSDPKSDPDDRILVLMRLKPNTPYLNLADRLGLLQD